MFRRLFHGYPATPEMAARLAIAGAICLVLSTTAGCCTAGGTAPDTSPSAAEVRLALISQMRSRGQWPARIDLERQPVVMAGVQPAPQCRSRAPSVTALDSGSAWTS